MGPLRRFWRLAAADRSLLIKAALWLGATRLALWLFPLRIVRRQLARAARLRRQRSVLPSQHRLTWAVSAARRLLPGATCLCQALATEALLAHSGHPAELRIGVVKTDAGRLSAHAWVESNGHIVIGDLPELSGYAPLPPLPSELA